MTRPPGRTPGLSPRQCKRVASPGNARAALSSLPLTFLRLKSQRQVQKQLLLRSDALPLVTQRDSPIVMTRPGVRPGRRVTFFASPKKVTKKRRPRLCRPAARGSRAVDARSGARLNSLRCAALKQTPHLFPLRASPTRRYTDGDHNCNGHFKSNGNCNGHGHGHFNCNGHFNGRARAPSIPPANMQLFFESFSRNTIKPLIR